MKWQPTQPPYEPPRGSPQARPMHPRASPPPMPHHPHHRRENPHYAAMYRPGFGQPRHVPLPPHGHGHFDARYYNHHRNPSYPPPVLPPHHLSQYGSPASHPRLFMEESPDARTSPPRDPMASPTADPFRAAGCTCKKSRCLKLYCQCFSLSSTCGPKCKCQTCHNTPLHAEDIEEARKTILDRNPSAFDDKFRGSPTSSPYRPGFTIHTAAWTPTYAPHVSGPGPAQMVAARQPTQRINKFGCKCRRSFCLKKYCECFQNDVHCGLHCRCSNCKNHPAEPGPPSTEDSLAVPAGISQTARAVSDETAKTPSNTEGESSEESEDRMAIMAAVAMTQLRPRHVSLGASKCGETVTTRKADLVTASPDSSVDESSTGPRKKAKTTSPERSTMESRNPSPVSVMTPHSYMQPHHHHVMPHHHLPHMHHHLARHHRPPNPFPFYPSPPPRTCPTYEDVIKSSGLPKSLSFRKICSKCGKTRGEHGELGFGNKCVYQDCGKCGAGIQMHLKAGSPMGILCGLTVEEGATPGSSAIYKRKIRDLAARAELQKSLQEDKRERAERLAQTLPQMS